MKYKVGDRVRIKSIDWYEKNKSNRGYVTIMCEAEVAFTIEMSSLCGQIVTISQKVYTQDVEFYRIREDRGTYMWTDEMFEGLVEEETNDCENCGLVRNSTRCLFTDNCPHNKQKNIIEIPKEYVLKDENGNVIPATKIVLEKKKREVILTQEQIDTMVHESCVLFCKHCGCGVPRETCTSLGSCKDHDEYRKSMRTFFEKHKK